MSRLACELGVVYFSSIKLGKEGAMAKGIERSRPPRVGIQLYQIVIENYKRKETLFVSSVRSTSAVALTL